MVDYSDLESRLNKDIECFVFDLIPSTNDYLANLDFCKNTQVCIANEQTQGKGQYNRSWLSQKKSSITFSIRRVFSTNIVLNGLSIVVALAVINTLEQYGVNQLKLKWPNDVYFEGKKLAGVLIENSVRNQHQSVVIGLGLNCNLNDNFSCNTAWTDLNKILGITIDLTSLSAKLINNIVDYCHLFETNGLKEFSQKWTQYDYLKNTQLALKHQNTNLKGIAKGIDLQGALIIQVYDKMIKVYSSEQIQVI